MYIDGNVFEVLDPSITTQPSFTTRRAPRAVLHRFQDANRDPTVDATVETLACDMKKPSGGN